MTSDTFASKLYGRVYAGLGEPKGKTGPQIVAEALTYPGYVVRTSSEQWYLSKNSDKSQDAVLEAPFDHGLDTVFTAASSVTEGYMIGGGDEVYVYYVAVSPAVNLSPGDIMVTSATDGMVMKFAYTDGTDITDSPLNFVGLCRETITGSVSDNKLIKVRLSR